MIKYKIPVNNIKESRLDLLYPLEKMKLFWFKGVLLGGGSLQTLVDPLQPVNDYDLFFQKIETFNIVRQVVENSGYKLSYKCKKGLLYSYVKPGMPKIQFILKQIYNSPWDLIESFDITSSMWAFDGSNIYTTKQCIKDTKQRIVNLNKVTYPIATMNRMGKYKYVKGYKIPHNTYTHLFESMGVDLRKYDTSLYID